MLRVRTLSGEGGGRCGVPILGTLCLLALGAGLDRLLVLGVVPKLEVPRPRKLADSDRT